MVVFQEEGATIKGQMHIVEVARSGKEAMEVGDEEKGR
jgi:hypothetical protein